MKEACLLVGPYCELLGGVSSNNRQVLVPQESQSEGRPSSPTPTSPRSAKLTRSGSFPYHAGLTEQITVSIAHAGSMPPAKMQTRPQECWNAASVDNPG